MGCSQVSHDLNNFLAHVAGFPTLNILKCGTNTEVFLYLYIYGLLVGLMLAMFFFHLALVRIRWLCFQTSLNTDEYYGMRLAILADIFRCRCRIDGNAADVEDDWFGASYVGLHVDDDVNGHVEKGVADDSAAVLWSD